MASAVRCATDVYVTRSVCMRLQNNDDREISMKTIKILGLLIIAALGLSIASAASASAAEASFLASETGTVTLKATSTQTFTTTPSGFKWECTTAAGTGTITAQMRKEQEEGKDPLSVLISIAYSKCEVFIGSTKIGTATVSLAAYLFHANGSVFVEEPVLIMVKPIIGAECSITVASQLVDNGAKYSNSGKNVIVESNATGITWTGSGGDCGTSGSAFTYVGNNEATLNSGTGTISWMEAK